jgi:hypothetical protein
LFMLVSLVGSLCPQIGFQLHDSSNSTCAETSQVGDVWSKSYKVCQT